MTASAGALPTRRAGVYLARLLPFTAILLFALAGYVAFGFPAHHDVSWMQHAGARWLDGAEPYVDVIEVNPPLILQLSIVVELVSRATGLWSMSVLRLLVLALAAGSVVACHVLLRRLLEDRRVAPHLLTLLLVYLFVALPRYEFGQREHIAVLATLPWMLLTATTMMHRTAPLSRGVRVAIGVAAGLGFALKPHFLLVWGLVGLAVLARRGPRALLRIEQGAVIVVGALYAVSVLLLTPGYLFVAQLAREAYGTYATLSPWVLLTMPQARLAGGALSLAALAFAVRRRRGGIDEANGLLLTLAAGVIGFTGAVLLQRRGWTYHWIPVQVCAGLLVGVAAVMLATALERRTARYARHAAVLASALTMVGLFWLTARGFAAARAEWRQMSGHTWQLPAMAALVERAGPEPTIAALSTNLTVGFPLVSYTEARWVMRFPTLWPLVGAYAPRDGSAGSFPYHAPGEMARAERFMFEAVVADLTAHRPTLLIVDTRPPGHVLHGFDYLLYFGQDARFAALLPEYRELPAIQRYRVFHRPRVD
jgi:hypothetical protein